VSSVESALLAVHLSAVIGQRNSLQTRLHLGIRLPDERKSTTRGSSCERSSANDYRGDSLTGWPTSKGHV